MAGEAERVQKARDLSKRAHDIIAAALGAAGGKPDALWVAASFLLASAAFALSDSREQRDELLMEAERAARKRMSELEAAGVPR